MTNTTDEMIRRIHVKVPKSNFGMIKSLRPIILKRGAYLSVVIIPRETPLLKDRPRYLLTYNQALINAQPCV